MKLICYAIHKTGLFPTLRPAPARREWMLATREAFATRCLPLNIANSHGWEMLCPVGFDALWNGDDSPSGLTIIPQDDKRWLPVSVFGYGVLTFHPMYLVRTEPDVNLWVQGPVNLFKDGIQALTGLVETDWSPFSFTMNWKFTRPGRIRFRRDEPFCHIFPVPRHYVESVEPEIRDLDEVPETKEMHALFCQRRTEFSRKLQVTGSEAQQQRWQKEYYRGLMPDGSDGPDFHQVKLRVRPFVDFSTAATGEATAEDHAAEQPAERQPTAGVGK